MMEIKELAGIVDGSLNEPIFYKQLRLGTI